MRGIFYDIESLKNVFTVCAFDPGDIDSKLKPENHVFGGNVDVFYIIDDGPISNSDMTEQTLSDIRTRIYEQNRNFNGTVCFYDLNDSRNAAMFAQMIGVSDRDYSFSDPSFKDRLNNRFRPVCDTDPEYDENEHPYFFGYNSYNYDTTMLAHYFENAFYVQKIFRPVTAAKMRKFNNRLFTPEYKEKMPDALRMKDTRKRTCGENIRRNMFLSGRHIDVARLNEKQSKVGLKRLLGMLGYQILESDKLTEGLDTLHDTDELAELIAYNCSDVVNLCCLFLHKNYQAQFVLKKQLLATYPELIYEQQKDPVYKLPNYHPDVSPKSVRQDRLFIDSSSAQFATKCLCPYGHLKDIPVVSYLYPSERKAKELGVKRVNVLDETKKFFYKNFEQPELRARFDEIYDYYKSLEGKNFNASKNYYADFNGSYNVRKLSDYEKVNGCLPYFNKDGTPSSCFVTFSVGGIHGAEYNKALYEHDREVCCQKKKEMDYVMAQFPDPVDLRKAKTVVMENGEEKSYTEFLKSGATMKKAEYREIAEPELFPRDSKGNYKLNDRYVFSSAAQTNHEDFTSYYPNMLRMMSAFWNPGLGYDRYAEIFDNKQKYGKLMKDPSISEEERSFYSVLREGTKLILNSASGAADTNFGSAIQMNNTILSMRIIGQMFSWRIGQAQTIAGADIISTNTDGLYSVLEEELNNEILERESADIGVEIEPEPIYLISKDSNNRMEMSGSRILSASGGTLACRSGPNPAKALAHPAVVDWALAEYLYTQREELDAPFERLYADFMITGAEDTFREEFPSEREAMIHTLLMFQNVIASSPSTFKYKYGIAVDSGNTVLLPHYNRTFIMDDDSDMVGLIYLREAAARKVDPKSVTRRRKNGDVLYSRDDETAMYVLKKNGVLDREIADRDVITQKVSNVDLDWKILVMNRSLYSLSNGEMRTILDNLNIEAYIDLLESAYENSWRNQTVKPQR